MKQQKGLGQDEVRCHAKGGGFAQGQWGSHGGAPIGNIYCDSCLGRMVLVEMMERGDSCSDPGESG